MKKLKILILLLVVTIIATTGLVSCDKADDPIITVQPSTSLTEAEINMLQFMREEEKLARDVYQYFSAKYGLNVFNNIKSSEQTHTSAVLAIMNQYNVPDIAATTPGVFNNEELQALYTALIEQGNASISAALVVGATIEDVDIRDLRVAVTTTTKTDIIDMYKRLECASDNHLRAFTNNLNGYGVTYTPQFISADDYTQIINAAHENCGF